jgi:hypothetical protein
MYFQGLVCPSSTQAACHLPLGLPYSSSQPTSSHTLSAPRFPSVPLPRSCGGVPILLGLLRPSSPAPPATRVALLGVAGGLVAGDADPAGGCCAALVGGGLVEALVGLVGPQPLPRTQVRRGSGSWWTEQSRHGVLLYVGHKRAK